MTVLKGLVRPVQTGEQAAKENALGEDLIAYFTVLNRTNHQIS